MKSILRVLAMLFAMLLCIEGMARIASTIKQDSLWKADWGYLIPGPNWKPVGQLERTYDGVAYQATKYGLVEEGYVFKENKPRIIIMGDSWLLGSRVLPRKSFIGYLKARFPDVDILNMSDLGYSSYQGCKLLPLVIDLKPSLVIVSYNSNDRKCVVGKYDMDSDWRFRRAVVMNNLVKYLHIFRGLNKIKRYIYPYSSRGGKISEMYPRVSREDYYENMSQIASELKKKNIPVIFVRYIKSPAGKKVFEEGVTYFKNSQYESAIKSFSRLTKDSIYAVLARIYLARVYEKMGLKEEAAKQLSFKIPYDNYIFGYNAIMYSDKEYNDIMQKVADQYGVEFLDPGRLEDATLFIDRTHFNEEGHKRFAEFLTPYIAKYFKEK